MNRLPMIPNRQYITDKNMTMLYQRWAGAKFPDIIGRCFLRQPFSMTEETKLSEISFKEFNFDKKITFGEICQDINIRGFVNTLLDSQNVIGDDRQYRFKAYMNRLHFLINKKILYTRMRLRKLHGFGIYQLRGVKVERYNEDNSIRKVASLSLVPTEARCIKSIRKYWDKSILPELQERNELATETFQKIQRDMKVEIKHQKEISCELDKWEEE